MMGARFAALAAAENPNVIPAAITPIVTGESARAPMADNSRGTNTMPNAPATSRNPNAKPTVETRPPMSTDPCSTMRVTIVKITRPITSSATAAPRTMRASVEESALRSPKTRAVMPTLVAASAAPRKSDAFTDSPRIEPAKYPDDIGTATPMMATRTDARPTLRNSSRSISRPTSANKMMTPTSARTRMASLGSTKPRREGPIMMPATISPITAGTPTRSDTSAAALAIIKIRARSRKIAPQSREPPAASRADITYLFIGAAVTLQEIERPPGVPLRSRSSLVGVPCAPNLGPARAEAPPSRSPRGEQS